MRFFFTFFSEPLEQFFHMKNQDATGVSDVSICVQARVLAPLPSVFFIGDQLPDLPETVLVDDCHPGKIITSIFFHSQKYPSFG